MKALKKLAVVLCVLAGVSFASEAAVVETLDVRSASMKKEVKVVCISPDRMAAGERCPVIYLLHGHGGNYNTWMTIKPELPEIADRLGVMFVCPDGQQSWYWDSPVNKDSRYETFVSSELVDYVDSHYSTLADRGHRAISGLSMGGHGAMWIAVRHKDRFGACGSMSGGLDIRPFPKNWNMSRQLGEYEQNREVWDAHTVINEIDTLQNGELAIYIDCGFDDFFLEVNENVHKKLLAMKIDHDFTTRPGAHNNKFWNNAIDYHILFFMKYFGRN